MSIHLEKLRDQLANGPMRARQLVEKLQLRQPTLSRAIAAMGDEVVRLGAGPSIHYALRDTARGIGETSVYRVSSEGTLRELGRLIPVRPDGYVMLQTDGKTLQVPYVTNIPNIWAGGEMLTPPSRHSEECFMLIDTPLKTLTVLEGF